VNPTSEPAQATSGTGAESSVDLQKLAERVYKLMLEDARIARSRGDRMKRVR
jgi:hypothetical protein